MESSAAVLEFWFGELDADGMADAEHRERWWRKDPNFDQLVRDRFETLYDAIVADEREDWRETPRDRLAYVIVLDQFSRNMFRDQAKMYAADPRCQQLSAAAVERGDHQRLATNEAVFLLMPLMHAEDLRAQERCVELFAELRDSKEGLAKERMAGNHGFALRHRDIIARFGRFPHRNAILGRQSSAEEQAFLREPGSSF